MKKIFYILFQLCLVLSAAAQSAPDSLATAPVAAADTLVPKMEEPAPEPVNNVNADDPSNFMTRMECFNTLKRFDQGRYFNVTTLRTIIKFKKKFTTRFDIPLVYNSLSLPEQPKQFGLGDLSFRLLGFNIFANPKSALTASVELVFNTATSPLLGTGKNLIAPLFSYSMMIKENKGIFSLAFQQVNSMWGDPERAQINFSKFQAILITFWSKRFWTVLSPELFVDYMNHDVSMNLRGRLACAPTPLVNVWADLGAGLFGDFIDRYQWSMEVGFRYFIYKKKHSGQSVNG